MKLKTKALSFVVLLAVGAAAFHFLDPTKMARDARNERVVIFTVTWLPAQRASDVHMEIDVNDGFFHGDRGKTSPWQWQATFPLGTKLDLDAIQFNHEGELWCTIQVTNGARGGPNPMIKNPDGTGFCAATVVL